MALGGKLSGVLNGWVLAIVTSSLFLNPLTGKGDIVIGMKTAGWYIAGIIIVLGLLPVFFVKERYYATDAKRQPQEGFLKSLKDSGGCGPLWSLIGVSFFLVLGAASIGALGQYVNIYYVFGGDLSAAAVVSGWRSLVLSIGGLALLPLWTWLGERFDKKSIVIAMLCFASFGHLLGYFFLRPDMPYLQIVSGFFESAAMGALWLFLPSMKADVADYDELSTARRREGSLNAFYSWFIKAALTLSVGAGGILLSITGFDVKLPAQSPEVLDRMFLLYLILPVIIWGVAIAFAFIYPLSRNRMDDIRSELESRRGKV
jgi:GPH family glycoside/pentoside/hexuronide:cation symporter